MFFTVRETVTKTSSGWMESLGVGWVKTVSRTVPELKIKSRYLNLRAP